MGESHITLSDYQRLILWLQGYVVIGKILKDGWRKEVNVYAFKCPKHGLTSNIVKGYDERLECPHCWKEVTSEK